MSSSLITLMMCSLRLMPLGSFSSRAFFWMFWLSSMTRATFTSACSRARWKSFTSSFTAASSTTGAFTSFCMALYRLLPSFSKTSWFHQLCYVRLQPYLIKISLIVWFTGNNSGKKIGEGIFCI